MCYIYYYINRLLNIYINENLVKIILGILRTNKVGVISYRQINMEDYN